MTDMHIEKLDGTIVEIPSTVDIKYPNHLMDYSQQLAKNDTNPQVYIAVIKRENGDIRHKYYSDACWELETFALEMFEQMCKKHDWYYDYSDDHRVWTQGRDSYSRLAGKYNVLVKKYPAATQAIWEATNPFLKEKHCETA